MKKSLVSLVAFLFVFLVQTSHAQVPELWGMTYGGGAYASGTIFKTDSNGDNHNLVESFYSYDGRNPYYSELCQYSNGKLYGVTLHGGINGSGTIFELDPTTNSYTKKIDLEGFNTGFSPAGGLTLANNGKLYGVSNGGGIYGNGALFEYDPVTNICIKKFDFDGPINGRIPYAKLLLANNGKLYGLTTEGGVNDVGVLFEYDVSTNTFTKKMDFDQVNLGSYPYGALIQASNGEIYGVTSYDGGLGYGGLFEYTISTNSIVTKHTFDDTNGGIATGGLIQSTNGKLYGMTANGGAFAEGVIYEYNISLNSYTKKIDLNPTLLGAGPTGRLMEAANGKMYGLISGGGANDSGTLIEYDPTTNAIIKKIDFDENAGSLPTGSLVQAFNGNLYGLLDGEGNNSLGTLFEYNVGLNSVDKIHDFEGAQNGSNPRNSLMQATNGKLYGLSNKGGSENKGVLFEFDPNTQVYTKKIDLDDSTGFGALSNLTELPNGKFYGLMHEGGTFGRGVIFEYDRVLNVYSRKHSFSMVDGSQPLGSLVLASNGKLYGMIRPANGGFGSLFEFDPTTNLFTKKIDFTGISNGSSPNGSLVLASNGELYGMTTQGGVFDYGIIFEYSPLTNTFTKKYDFTPSSGSYPYGDLIQADNGKLYGMTLGGGVNSQGVIFEFDITINSFTKKFDFDGTTSGANPYGSLLEASNGKLYGMTVNGGTSGKGVLFEYNIPTNTVLKKLDFNGTNGSNPYGSLIEIMGACVANSGSENITICDTYTWSANNNTYTTSGSYTEVLTNIGGCDSTATLNLIINNSTTTSVNQTACDSYTWAMDGTTYTTSGTYTHLGTNGSGCPLTTTLNLTINNVNVGVANNSPTLVANQSGANYQWINCSDNSQIIGANSDSFTATENGSYAVIISMNGCTDTSTCEIIQNVSLNELENDNFKIYPNPFSTSVNIVFDNEQVDTKITILDMTGKKLKFLNFSGQQVVIENENWDSGVYYIQFQDQHNKFQTKKIIIN